jgi:hypothetical protein
MTKDDLYEIAQADTPDQIHVPNTWHGIIVWAVARFGVGMIVAAAFAYSTKVVYDDMRSDREQLLAAYQDNTRVVESFAAKLSELVKSIDESRRDGAMR